jgi:putative ABC transport system ATP-binding protein/lipoprotein-releasing system ATP-binding protein
MITVKHLHKYYQVGGERFAAAEDINLTIDKAEMVSIVGHSGSGKTTLLSLIGGLTRPDSGEVEIDAVNLWSMDDNQLSGFRNQKISFIYQFASLIPTLTVYENIILPTAFGKYSTDTADRAQSLLERVGLAKQSRYYPAQLSGGQQRRVAIARAFINQPAVLLADEPTGDLDEATENEIMELFADMNRQENITFVIVTHSSEIAGRAGRSLMMKDGRIVND